MIQETFDILRRLAATSTLSSSRNFTDVLTSRIVQACTAPNLLAAVEMLARTLGSETGYIGGDIKAAFLSKASSADAQRVLSWLRRHPNIAAMIMSLRKDEDYQRSLAAIDLPEDGFADEGVAPATRPYQVGVVVQCLSPLAHGSDDKAGNATLFRRCQVLSTTGNVLRLPYYAGNALRGQLRDLLADHYLAAIGIVPNRTRPPVALWFFHALYAGGVLEEGGDAAKAVGRELGNNGAIRAQGVHRFRDHLPALSLLGVALGNRVLPGRIQVGDLRPRCRQWGHGTLDADELMEWTYLTRREDHEGYQDHHGMIANTEALRAGTVLDGGIDIDTHASELERSALGLGLALLQQRGLLGAETRRGFGRVEIEVSNAPDPRPYLDWLASERDVILGYLAEIGATDISHNDAILAAAAARKTKTTEKRSKPAAEVPMQDDPLPDDLIQCTPSA